MTRMIQWVALIALFAMSMPCVQAEDLVLADFESAQYAPWTAQGEAFGPGPASGRLEGQMEVSGFRGKRLVNSYHGGDGATGTLTSPPFRIERKCISFLIGGGGYPGETCMNLIVNGEAVRTATGPNTVSGGSERLGWHTWDVAELQGEEAILEIVDHRQGGWGHINIDHIVQCDTPFVTEKSMNILAKKHYLNLPVKTGEPKRRMRLLQDGNVVREFEIELSDTPDFWVFVDLTPFKDEMLTVWTDAVDRDSKVMDLIAQDDAIRGAEDAYAEIYRPQFHFSPLRGWNNDPNGLVYLDGEYHLYFQHNPYGWNWGNMHWGHAVSTDLVHWKQLPIALYPYAFGDWAFSGSAIVDKDNTAGFKTGDEDVIVAAYTSTGRGECIVYSNDRGRTFTEYEGNPVVEHTGRDPKLIWYAPGRHWVMACYDEDGSDRRIAFYTSPDLKTWTFQSRIDGYFECPEIFELPVDGDAKNTRWVVYAADGDYAIGAFDGKTFTPESGKHRFNYGDCFYASQTFNDIPPEDGRRIQIAWGRAGNPTMPFNQMMDFPVSLTLRGTAEGPRLFAEPIREIELLHQDPRTWKDTPLKPGENPLKDIQGDMLHIRAVLEPGSAKEVGFNLFGLALTYTPATQELACKGKTASLALEDGAITLELLLDRLSLEIFGNQGRIYMPMTFQAAEDSPGVEIFAKGGEAAIRSLEIFHLRSAW